jgi:hypothetical protein
MLLYISIEPLNLGFTRKTGLEELSKHLGHFLLTSLAPGITKNDSSSTALEAVSQLVHKPKDRPFLSPRVSHFLKVRTLLGFPAHLGG